VELDELEGDCGGQVERLLYSISAGEVESTMAMLADSMSVRMFNQTDRSYSCASDSTSVRVFLEWFFGRTKSANNFTVNKKVSDDGNVCAPPTAFFAWDCDDAAFSNGSCVCVFLPGTLKMHRMHIVVDFPITTATDLPPNIIRGDDLLNRIKVPLAEGAPSAATTFAHHFSTFGKGVSPDSSGKPSDAVSVAREQMLDFSKDAILNVYNHVMKKYEIRSTTDSILDYFGNLYPTFQDVTSMDAPVWEVEEQSASLGGIVFLAWRCPTSGYFSGTDTFVLDSNQQIVRQYVIDVKRQLD